VGAIRVEAIELVGIVVCRAATHVIELLLSIGMLDVKKRLVAHRLILVGLDKVAALD
jgi:hypothetical protein